jgi:hypothetical protein
MGQKRDNRSKTGLWLLAGGILAGLATVAYFKLRRSEKRVTLPAEVRGLEDAVLAALKSDDILRRRGIDVAVIAPGIVELTGSVETEEEAHHAVAVVQRIPSVRTVLNRLDLSRLEHRVRRRAAGGDSGSGSRWYGMSVGMGRRRQSKGTDPAQRDDHADMLEDALAPDAEEALADVTQERIERAARSNEVS